MAHGGGAKYSVKEVVTAVERITGHKVPTHITARRPGDPPELVADPSLAEKLLKWKAKRSLDDIVRQRGSGLKKSKVYLRI
jgi:UDP-glucose 4-epimerase